MSDYPNVYADEPKKPGMSSGAKIAIGCGATLLLVILLICGGAITWWFVSWGAYEDFGKEFAQQGYTLQNGGGGVSIEQSQTGPIAIVARAVNIEANIDGNVAVASLAANIEGVIDGDLDFYGMALNIGPNGRITGDVRIRSATAVNIEGIIEGDLTGSWRALQDNRRQPTAPAPAP